MEEVIGISGNKNKNYWSLNLFEISKPSQAARPLERITPRPYTIKLFH